MARNKNESKKSANKRESVKHAKSSKCVKFSKKATVIKKVKGSTVNSKIPVKKSTALLPIKPTQWANMVIYYLNCLKNNIMKCHSETKPVELVDTNTLKKSRKKKDDVLPDTSKTSSSFPSLQSYIKAGFEAGKRKAIRIVAASLDYGMACGIIKKVGDYYTYKPAEKPIHYSSSTSLERIKKVKRLPRRSTPARETSETDICEHCQKLKCQTKVRKKESKRSKSCGNKYKYTYSDDDS